MSTVSVSLPADGSTIDAADYNSPINSIVNEINGNLDNNNIKSGAAIDGAKLATNSVGVAPLNFSVLLPSLFTAFGTSVTSDTNPGSLGGTRKYVDLGGIKLAWGLTGGVSTPSAGASGNITMPTSFFTAIAAVQVTATNMTVDARASTAVTAISTSTVSVATWNPVNAGTCQVGWFVIGT